MAAILLFARSPLPASALAIGSMAPDAPYYLPIPASGAHTHSLVGAVGIDLLVGFVAFVAWQAFVGPGVVALAPPAVRARVAGYPVGLRGTLGRPALLGATVVALVTGALTHIV